MRLILASSSPRRRELLGTLGIPFEIIKPDVDETQHPDEPPFDYVARISRSKAHAAASQVMPRGDAVVLAADTIVVAADTVGVLEDDSVQGELLAKPEDADDARAMLKKLRGRPHIVATQIVLLVLDSRGHVIDEYARRAVTRVTMREYTDDEIDAYVATGDPMDKAGSYAIQHPVFQPVARIDGCYNNVVGLPLCEVKRGLAALGVEGVIAPQGCDCPPYLAGV